MKSGLQAYVELIAEQHDCYATWLPGTAIAVGEIGRISRSGAFQRTGSLAGRTTMPEPRAWPEPDQAISTSDDVSFSAEGGADADDVVGILGQIGGKLDITFKRGNAAALILQDVTRHEFEEEQAVRTAMKGLLADGEIDHDEVVVTYVLEARSGVIATSADATSETDAAIDAGVGVGALTVARLEGGLEVTSMSSSHTVVTAGPGRPITPMYRALVFRRNRQWWSFWKSYIEIGAAIPARPFARPRSDLDAIAASRPSLADAPADAAAHETEAP